MKGSKRKRAIPLLITIGILLSMNCADFKAKSEFNEGKKYQKQFEYQNAIKKYEDVILKYSKTQWADSARKYMNECRTILFILSELTYIDSLLTKKEDELAEKKVNYIKSFKISDENIQKEIQQRVNKIDEIKKTKFEYIWKVVKDRLDKGASAQVALGEFYGTEIKWKAKPSYICFGLDRFNPPILFKIGKDGEFFGVPSFGLDQLKFLLFCEAHQGKLVELEGRLIGVYPFPFEGLIVEVSAIKLIEK